MIDWTGYATGAIVAPPAATAGFKSLFDFVGYSVGQGEATPAPIAARSGHAQRRARIIEDDSEELLLLV